MRALLDTHVLLRALAAPLELSATARALIEESDNDLLVSAVSAWEIATEFGIGKLPGAESLLDDYGEHLARLRVTELPIDGRAAPTAGMLDWSHRDPFDRMIVARATLTGSGLLSADRRFSEVAGVSLS